MVTRPAAASLARAREVRLCPPGQPRQLGHRLGPAVADDPQGIEKTPAPSRAGSLTGGVGIRLVKQLLDGDLQRRQVAN